MQKENRMPAMKFSFIMMVVGIIVVLFGGALKLIQNAMQWQKVIFDLPWFIVIVGAGLLLYGIMLYFRNKGHNVDIDISSHAIKRFLLNNAILLALVVLVIVIMIIQPRFMQLKVLRDILAQASPRMLIALGICFTLLIAGTDLSAGRMVGLAAVISASMMQNADYANRFFPNLPQISIIIPIIAAILACMLFGLLNGFLVAKFDMHPFIATLAVQVIIYGTCSLYFDMPPNRSQPIGGIRPDFAQIGQYRILDEIPVLIPIAIAFTIAIWFILNKTVFGKNVYAIGGNREAAVVSGINVPVTIVGIFVLASALYGVGGVLEAARTAGATNNYGMSYELDAIAACVVGGVSLNGGVGKVSGIVSGVLVFTVIQYGLQFINVNPNWQQIIKGVIIAVAVAIDLSKYRKK